MTFPPGMNPLAPQTGAPAQPAAGFVLSIPADPTWEPFETTDTLDQDGYYCGRIIKESARTQSTGSPGVFWTIQIFDQDAAGKIVSKFMPDPNTTKGNTWFLWRGAMRSIVGDTGAGKGAFQYTLGAFTGQYVYFKTEPYLDDGTHRTSVASWVTRPEWEEAVKSNRHRWAPKLPTGGTSPGVGALPGGVPGGFALPGTPGGGGSNVMPPAPTPPAPMAPQPGAAPMQQAPAPAAPAVPPAPAAPPAQTGFAPPVGFGPPQGPPTNGAPQPPQTGFSAPFPGMPPGPPR